MGKIKKYTASLLAAVMVAGICLGGCGDNAGRADSSEDEKQDLAKDEGSDGGVLTKGGKITVFQSKAEITEDLAALAQEYTKETGVEVEIKETTGDSYFSDLKTNLVNGDGPTVFFLQPGAEWNQAVRLQRRSMPL